MALRIVFVLLTLSIAACSSGGGNGGGTVAGCSASTAEAPFLGCWITNGCQAMENPVNSQSIWGHMRYHFKDDGKLYNKVSVYDNADCMGTALYQDTSEMSTDLAFENLGTETMDSGLSGNRLAVHDVEAAALGTYDVLTTITTDNRLCLSSNLRLTVEGYSFSFSDATTVDFNNCLDKVN